MALLSPTYPPAPPLLTPESAQGPGGLWNQEFPSPSPNSNQMAQVENHCSPGPSRELAAAVPGVCAVRGEDESTSTPPPPPRVPRGPGAPSQSLGDAGAPAVA